MCAHDFMHLDNMTDTLRVSGVPFWTTDRNWCQAVRCFGLTSVEILLLT